MSYRNNKYKDYYRVCSVYLAHTEYTDICITNFGDTNTFYAHKHIGMG